LIERNPITGDPVIVAPDRAGRPNMFSHEETCPFCPGNEAMTPPDVAVVGDPWRVRAFANKYPATESHEVIVESPGHDDDFGSISHAEEAVAVYLARYRELSRRNAHVTIFKNHGPMAGASIAHLHSQVIGTPFVPPRIASEAASFSPRCPLCSTLDGPLIRETENYRWFAPRGSMFAFEQWIVPNEHAPAISEPRELWRLLQGAARAMRGVSASYNWIFINFPLDTNAHWYVQLFPRLSPHAGFEIGSGSALNTVDAQETARRFRP
jgi:UDPglucose--hexose-1-phosphate uridylyltransferase